MRLSEIQHLFEYPILEIRRLLRAGGNYQWSTRFVSRTLAIELGEAAKLIDTLLGEGFIAPSKDWDGRRYELTMKGRALAMANARLIRRSTAERLVSEFLQRVEAVNNDPKFCFWIDEVLVFGSFLTDSETLGDVDLGLSYTSRTDDKKDFDQLSEARIKEAEAAGRDFPRFIDRLFWPLREIQLMLRNRSGSLSLHDLRGERELIEALPHRQIYLRSNGISVTSSAQVQGQIDASVSAGTR
jgi:hypothetical protein